VNSTITAQASNVPSSPDGIYDARLCGGSNFSVFDGTYSHDFYFQGSTYTSGVGVRQYWLEEVWWAGILNLADYNFSVPCY
jgi:hypothetical protein